MPRRIVLIFFLAGGLWWNASAQFASVRGVVVDAEGGTPLSGANIRLHSREHGFRGTATDGVGSFTFPSVRPGTYVLTASYVGFETFSDTFGVAFGVNVYQRVELKVSSGKLDELVVESEPQPEVEKPGAGHLQIRPMALQRVPMPDVTADLAAFLTTRPGVVTVGDRGGQLFVRGGTPTQNLILLDGMRLFQPFHIVGFYSVFPADIISEADFFAGGFNARYGGRISSVIDVSTRNGNKRDFAGAVSMAPFLASIRAEVPFVPGKVSLLASARESIIERIAPDLLGEKLPYRFGDRFVKVHAYLNRTSSFTATLLDSFDEGDVADLDDAEKRSEWRNTAFGGRYLYLPPEYPLLTELAVYGTRYSSRFLPAVDQQRKSDVGAAHADIRFAYLLGPMQVHFGIFAGTSTMTYDLGEAQPEREESVTEGGVYASFEWDATESFRMEPGIRLQNYSSGIGDALEPRIRLRWSPGGSDANHIFTAAWGVYQQQILGLNNQRDVTDAFIAWVPVPDNSPVPRSTHFILGVQEKIGQSFQIGAEGYHREMENIFFPLLTDGFGIANTLQRVKGSARGLELTVDFARPWLYAHAGYSLSAVEYLRTEAQIITRPNELGDLEETTLPGSDRFNPPHDRRHQFNVMTQITLGPYRASLRWHFGSGLPFTQVHGFYDYAPPDSPDDSDFLDENGALQVSFAKPYAERLPPYHRLDFSGERDFVFERWRLTVQAGVVNVYDRSNIFSYDMLLGRRVDQLPLIPSLGIRVEVF